MQRFLKKRSSFQRSGFWSFHLEKPTSSSSRDPLVSATSNEQSSFTSLTSCLHFDSENSNDYNNNNICGNKLYSRLYCNRSNALLAQHVQPPRDSSSSTSSSKDEHRNEEPNGEDARYHNTNAHTTKEGPFSSYTPPFASTYRKFSPRAALQGILASRLSKGNIDVQRSPLYRSFMGKSTRFVSRKHLSAGLGDGRVVLTREVIQGLEQEPLTHSPPSYLNDHICILLVKLLRWLSDRCFRERYIHRATMLVPIASVPPSAGAVGAYLRMFLAPQQRLDNAPYVPHYVYEAYKREEEAKKNNQMRNEDQSKPFAPMDPSVLPNNYAKELRGLLSQAECHTIHYQILLPMANIMPVERGLVLLLQFAHFMIFQFLFLVYPRMGFRLMAYLAEESSVVWTQMINDIDLGKIAECKVPQLALSYWGLESGFRAQEAPLPVPTEQGEDTQQHPTESTNVAQSVTSEEKASDLEETKELKKENVEKETKGKINHTIAAKKPMDVLTLRDVILLIRSDEMIYRDLNHEVANQLDEYKKTKGHPLFDKLLKKFK